MVTDEPWCRWVGGLPDTHGSPQMSKSHSTFTDELGTSFSDEPYGGDGIPEVLNEDGSEGCQILPALLRCQNLIQGFPTKFTVCISLSTTLTFKTVSDEPYGGDGIPEVLNEDWSEGCQILPALLRTAPNKATGCHAGCISVQRKLISLFVKKNLAYFLLQSTSGLIKVPLEVP